jgi:hypothetical protein
MKSNPVLSVYMKLIKLNCKKMKTKWFASFIVLFLFSIAAQSQPNRIERRFDENQRERIREGWRSGELTPREFSHLKREQRHLHRAERRMLRDGRLGPVERHRLHKMKRHCSRDIWKKKHNNERRFR